MKFQIQNAAKVIRMVTALFFLFIFFALETAPAQNAPTITLGQKITTASSIAIPVTVTNFVDIISCNQSIFYDNSVASVTSVALATGLPGFFDIGTTNPGELTISWSTSSGTPVTLTDNSVFFTIHFSKVSNGYSDIIWNTDYIIRLWSDKNYNLLNDEPVENYYFNGFLEFQGDAPITSIANVTACPGASIDIPVTVENFNTIGSFNLKLHYDEAVLEYNGFTNNSGFPGLGVSNPIPGEINSSGFFNNVEGFTIANNEVFYTLHFELLSPVVSYLTWFDDDGASCEYASPYPDFNTLDDTPTENYYINGSVSPAPTADIKVYLEGLYNTATGSMNKTKDFDGTNIVDKFNGTIADLITIELHDPGNYGAPVRTFPGIPLHQNGTASFCADGVSGSYYLTVVTRNHLETVSTNPVDFSATVNYDFTTASEQAYGSNMKQLATGVWGIYAGDVDKDGVIDLSDREPINDDYLITKRGYFPNDINGDGIIDLSDREIVNDSYLQTITRKIPE